jgi:hypothetical protein
MSVDVRRSDDLEDQYQQYRALSMSAVVTLILGIISLPVLIFPHLFIIPLAGMILGAYSVLSLRKRGNEFTGLGAARVGLALCTIFFIGGIAYDAYCYATEVPDGYRRISFQELQPDKSHPELPIPPTAVELSGEKVFVKGYVYPDGQSSNIKQFVLVPDMGTCCFGGQPKLTDMIQVTLRDPHRIEYSYYRRKLAGVLKVSNQKKPVSGLDGVYYELDAESVE